MKTMRIRNLLTLAVCCLAAVLLSGAALAADADIVDSGTYGRNLTWTLDSEGTLTISGQGKMPDSYYYSLPWYSKMDSIKTVCIDSGVTSIGNDALYGCTGLTSITIPDSVTSIGSAVFNKCSKLKSIEIPNSVTSIGNGAFNGCTSLTSITIPNSMTSIGSHVFAGCTGLTSVTIPDSVTSIGDGAFYGCTGLTSVTIPDSVTSIGSYAFISCAGLTSVTIPSSVTSIGEFAFGRCTGLTSITIPDSVTNIGICAFYGCTGLTSITIPDSVASISEDMFSGCTGLTSVTIPDSVADIGENAFSGCSNIETVYYTGSQSKWQSITIGSGNDALTGADIRYNCAYGGTEEYRLEGITVTAAGETVQELCAGELLVSIAVRHMQGDSGAVVMLAQYDAEGRYQGLLWLTLDEMPLDMALKVTLPVDNSDGKIANLKAFVVSSILSPVPMGSAVSFGSV